MKYACKKEHVQKHCTVHHRHQIKIEKGFRKLVCVGSTRKIIVPSKGGDCPLRPSGKKLRAVKVVQVGLGVKCRQVVELPITVIHRHTAMEGP